MYFTLGWGLLTTAVVGAVGVGGAIASAAITQFFADKRFSLERRDARYQAQREVVAEVIAVATRVLANSRLVTTGALSQAAPRSVLPALSGLQHDRVVMPLVVARSKLIVSDADVLNCLSSVGDSAGEAMRCALAFGENHGPDSAVAAAAALRAVDDLDKRANELLMTARARLTVPERGR
ncbi:hypothetical protein [Nocardia blacklockiae]|uniref:hypothetical protein n=1 Tax=Nocardia blacklockiae TaxID=480036 RepID=UPI00189365BF|nr:hypothetical protein [Nocardia blacklockiae]MBF6176607.1 hypothetical protein [Nocardia blacklockiae]